MPQRVYGIVTQVLVPLVVVSSGLVSLASWFAFQGVAEANREATLREIGVEALRRSEADSQLFTLAENNLLQARSVLAKRLREPALALPVAPRPDGTWRLVPTSGDKPLAAFVSRVSDGAEAQREVATAIAMLGELGPSWCRGLPAIAIAAPRRWLACWGDAYADLPATMLPEDPVLLTNELSLLALPDDGIRWSNTYLEPATDTWCVTALVPLATDQGKIALFHPVPVRELLAQLGSGMVAGTTTVILDRRGRSIACTGQPLPAEAPGEISMPMPTRLAAAVANLMEPATGVRPAAGGDGWLAVSRLAGPGWTIVTHLPPEVVLEPARRQALFALLLGAITSATLAVAIAAILRWRIATPIEGLRTEVARLAAGGKPPAHRPPRADEIGELIAAVDHMAIEVNASHAEVSQALAALGRREQLYRALFAAAADAVLVLRDGKVIEANQRAGRLFDVAPDALTGCVLADLAPELQADGTPSPTRFAEYQADVDLTAGAWRARRQDGSELDTEISIGRVSHQDGDLQVIALRDVTERNQLDQQLRQVQKMETIGQLAGGVAHDFNNLLTGMLGSAELIGRRLPHDERSRELIGRILQAGQRAAALVSKLLAFARKGRQVSTPIDVHEVVRETCALLERSIDRRIELKQELTAERSVVIGDSTQLQSALLNLGVNARDAMPEGGRLEFASRLRVIDAATARSFAPTLDEGVHLEVTVRDSGMGMSPAVIARLYEPFFTTKPPGKGTGLGLTAVLRTVHDHHGAITVESEPGAGTTFRILLPLSELSAARLAVDANPVSGKGRILVIDDDDLVRRTAVEMLRTLGYETTEANDGRAGVEAYKAGHFAAVLIDMEMPRLRGIDCIRELRSIDPAVRAILCSGFNRDHGGDMRTAGFQGFLAKPYRLYELSRVISDLITERKPA